MEIKYCENPTLFAYTNNKTSFAVHPICTEFLGNDDHLKKGAATFISEDKSHDLQQVNLTVWQEDIINK